MPCSVNGSGASPASPAHPTQAPSRPFMTDSIAVTSPPGLVRHEELPSGSATRSTGSRLAATTRSKVLRLLGTALTSTGLIGCVHPMRLPLAVARGAGLPSGHEDLGCGAPQG